MQDAQRALGITTTKGARRVPISFHSANKGTEHGRHDPCLERLRAVRPKALFVGRKDAKQTPSPSFRSASADLNLSSGSATEFSIVSLSLARGKLYNFPQGAAEQAPMFGAIGEAGQYFVLIRWHLGFMSAPHWYETDRPCVVLSGTWYVASGEDFAPEKTVPAPAG